ncbi:MAG TPA: cytochrome c oxidase subunit II [Gemmatimonadales bacterium]|jgi:cytochrome c oxidase subunit 2
MRHLRAPRRWYRLLGLLCALALVVAACGGPYPQSTLNPRGDFAEIVDAVFMKTVYLATIVFVLVEGALLWTVFKFRGKPTDPDPEQIHGSTVIEILWTIIPAVVLAVVAVPTVRAIFSTAAVPTTSPDGQKPLKVEVIGHQWFWEFRYPDLGITVGNELHVPLNRTIDLRMKSNDVIHAFWVPQFAGKRDIFPNRETRLWFTPQVTGEFPGACGEFCGTEHGRMDFYLMVDSAPKFDAWVARRKNDSTMQFNGMPIVAAAADSSVALAVVDPKVEEGKKLFLSKTCSGCHSVSSMHPLRGQVGPNLSGIGTRKMIGAGWLPNTDENLRDWIEHTQKVKPDVLMKGLPPISDDEANALIAYLRTLR